MKKLSILVMSFLLISASSLLTSCSKDDSTNPTDVKPVVNFKGGATYTSVDASFPVGSEFKVGIVASSNVSSGAKLVKFTVIRTFNNLPSTAIDTVLNTTAFNVDIIATTRSVVGTERWTYTITDKDNQVVELSLNITTQQVYGPLTEFTMKVLGAQKTITGSSFASIDGTVYGLADAKTNAGKIDWLYFYGATNLATLAAPIDADAAIVFSDPLNGVATWSVRNATKFKKVTDQITWSAITNDSALIALTSSGVTNTKVNSLSKNDILAFITASGKKGIIRVDDITTSESGQITISVKVQQTKK